MSDHGLQQQLVHLGEALRRINERAVSTRSAGFRIPVVDVDPATDDPTNIWGFDDGRLRWRGTDGAVHELVPNVDWRAQVPTFATDPSQSSGWRLWFNGSTGELRGRLANGSVVRYAPVTAGSSSDGGQGAAGGSSSTKPKQPDPKPRRYTRTYDATWARSFCPRHGAEGGRELYYGDSTYSTSHGFRRVMIGFNDAAIRSDLGGATIRRVELHMVNRHAHYNGGVDVHFGAHNSAGVPGSFGAVRRNVKTLHFPKVGSGEFWRDVPLWYGRALRDNNIKGLTVHQPSGSNAFYGSLDPDSVRLRVTYTK